MDIDKSLTEIDINELVSQIGVPFSSISDKAIELCIKNKQFLPIQYIYDVNLLIYRTKLQHTLRIATIVNEIQNNTYNYNYPIVIWDDSEDGNNHIWDTDGNGDHHIRAFYYCKKNIYMSVNRCG